VALLLVRRGIVRVRPLHGGLDGWRDRGLPLVMAGAAPAAATAPPS